MTSSMKQTCKLSINELNVKYSNKITIIEVIGDVYIKEEDRLIKFIWTTNHDKTALIITSGTCVTSDFKNTLKLILNGYINGLTHSTKLNYNFDTPIGCEFER